MHAAQPPASSGHLRHRSAALTPGSHRLRWSPLWSSVSLEFIGTARVSPRSSLRARRLHRPYRHNLPRALPAPPRSPPSIPQSVPTKDRTDVCAGFIPDKTSDSNCLGSSLRSDLRVQLGPEAPSRLPAEGPLPPPASNPEFSTKRLQLAGDQASSGFSLPTKLMPFRKCPPNPQTIRQDQHLPRGLEPEVPSATCRVWRDNHSHILFHCFSCSSRLWGKGVCVWGGVLYLFYYLFVY